MKPDLQLVTKTKGAGRPKQPIEKRKVLGDRPHQNRKGPPDIPMGITLGIDPLPESPPIKLTSYEKECWDSITGTQRALKNSAWIFRSDCAYIIASCFLYGRLMEVRDEINAMNAKGLKYLDSNGRANPLINVEAGLVAKYQSSLAALGMVPTKRQLTAAPESVEDEDGLLK